MNNIKVSVGQKYMYSGPISVGNSSANFKGVVKLEKTDKDFYLFTVISVDNMSTSSSKVRIGSKFVIGDDKLNNLSDIAMNESSANNNTFNTLYSWIEIFGGKSLLAKKNITNGNFLEKSLRDGSITVEEIEKVTNNMGSDTKFSELPMFKKVKDSLDISDSGFIKYGDEDFFKLGNDIDTNPHYKGKVDEHHSEYGGIEPYDAIDIAAQYTDEDLEPVASQVVKTPEELYLMLVDYIPSQYKQKFKQDFMKAYNLTSLKELELNETKVLAFSEYKIYMVDIENENHHLTTYKIDSTPLMTPHDKVDEALYCAYIEYNKWYSYGQLTTNTHITDADLSDMDYIDFKDELIISDMSKDDELYIEARGYFNKVGGVPTYIARYEDTLILIKAVANKIFESKNKMKNKLKGGKGDNVTADQVNPYELRKGINIEMEHTDDVATAVEIAIDHLTEDPMYYSNLIAFEDSTKKKNRADVPKEVPKKKKINTAPESMKDKKNAMEVDKKDVGKKNAGDRLNKKENAKGKPKGVKTMPVKPKKAKGIKNAFKTPGKETKKKLDEGLDIGASKLNSQYITSRQFILILAKVHEKNMPALEKALIDVAAKTALSEDRIPFEPIKRVLAVNKTSIGDLMPNLNETPNSINLNEGVSLLKEMWNLKKG